MVLCFGLYAVEYDACQLHVLGGEAVKTVANLAARRVILSDGVDDAVGIAAQEAYIGDQAAGRGIEDDIVEMGPKALNPPAGGSGIEKVGVAEHLILIEHLEGAALHERDRGVRLFRTVGLQGKDGMKILLPEVSVDQEGLGPGIRQGQGQIGGDGGLSLAGKRAGNQDNVAAFVGVKIAEYL